jgi:hypothetical protein
MGLVLPLMAASTEAAAAPPPNDTFVGAQPLSGATGSINGSTVEATADPGELDYPAHSVWFKWTAPTSERYVFIVGGASIRARIEVDQGSSVGTLTHLVGAADSTLAGETRVSFVATAGADYDVRIDDSDGLSGTFTLRWFDPAHDPTPPNDDYANAATLSGVAGSVTGSTVDATMEPNEPDETGASANSGIAQHSVWFKWTAPATGRLELRTENSSFDPAVGISVPGFSAFPHVDVIDQNDNLNSWSTESWLGPNVTAGREYHIAVAGRTHGAGTFTLRWRMLVPSTDITMPTAIFNSVTPGQTVGGTLSLSVDAADNVAVAYARFTLISDAGASSQVIAVIDASPYAIGWDTRLVPDGRYTIDAYVVDTSGNASGSTGYPIHVHNTPPQTTIFSHVVDGATASFWLSGSAFDDTFECSLDAGGFAPCANRPQYTGLAAGSHTFAARASNAGLTDLSPDSFSWVVAAPPSGGGSDDGGGAPSGGGAGGGASSSGGGASSGGGGGGGGGSGSIYPDLSVVITADAATPPPVGSPLVYQFTVADRPQTVGASDVLAEVTLPAGFTVTRTYTDRGKGCTIGAPGLVCDLDFVSPDAAGHVTIWGTVGQAGPQTFVVRTRHFLQDGNPADDSTTLTLQSAAATPPPASTATTVSTHAKAPHATRPPAIIGAHTTGAILRVRQPTWSSPPTRLAYQWQICTKKFCAAIKDATKPTLKLRAADARGSVRVVVTATIAGRHVTSVSPMFRAP